MVLKLTPCVFLQWQCWCSADHVILGLVWASGGVLLARNPMQTDDEHLWLYLIIYLPCTHVFRPFRSSPRMTACASVICLPTLRPLHKARTLSVERFLLCCSLQLHATYQNTSADRDHQRRSTIEAETQHGLFNSGERPVTPCGIPLSHYTFQQSQGVRCSSSCCFCGRGEPNCRSYDAPNMFCSDETLVQLLSGLVLYVIAQAAMLAHQGCSSAASSRTCQQRKSSGRHTSESLFHRVCSSCM
jgi:hypothetical protein